MGIILGSACGVTHFLSLVYGVFMFTLFPGRGVITINQVSLSSFLTDPTTCTWIRNGGIISNNASYSITLFSNTLPTD